MFRFLKFWAKITSLRISVDLDSYLEKLRRLSRRKIKRIKDPNERLAALRKYDSLIAK